MLDTHEADTPLVCVTWTRKMLVVPYLQTAHQLIPASMCMERLHSLKNSTITICVLCKNGHL